jgi:phosphohistidine phosphatase SixA
MDRRSAPGRTRDRFPPWRNLSDQADTDPLNPQNVAKQRQLNDDGRALAKSIGESMHKLRIPVAQVQTSMFQRAATPAHCWASAVLKPRLISLKAVWS